jgi:hypothetical protein
VTLFIDYRIKLTTEKAIFKLINEVLKGLNKLMVEGIICDLEKAFGSINHNIFFYLNFISVE